LHAQLVEHATCDLKIVSFHVGGRVYFKNKKTKQQQQQKAVLYDLQSQELQEKPILISWPQIISPGVSG